MEYYIDTSVLAAYYCPESTSSRVEKLLKTVKNPVISWLTELELVSAIAKKVRMRLIDEDDAKSMVRTFEQHVNDHTYQRIAIHANYFTQAQKWLSEFSTPLRTLDALQLAIAHQENLVLVTADKILADAGIHFGAKVKLVT